MREMDPLCRAKKYEAKKLGQMAPGLGKRKTEFPKKSYDVYQASAYELYLSIAFKIAFG